MTDSIDSSPSNNDPLGLFLNHVSFSWPKGSKVIDDCTFSLPRNGLWMVVGRNGSGKSTLFRLIAGMIKPQSGELYAPLKTSLMFQNPDHQLLLPTCRSDLLLSVPLNLSPVEREERVNQVLEEVGMKGLSNRPIHMLSGGQKQRLALAGALASGAGLLLLDEPTALLDPSSQRSVLEIVANLTRNPKKSIVALWITHRLEELNYCHGAAIMQKGCVGEWKSGKKLFQELNPLAVRRV